MVKTTGTKQHHRNQNCKILIPVVLSCQPDMIMLPVTPMSSSAIGT